MSRTRLMIAATLGILAALVLFPAIAHADELPPGGTYLDDDLLFEEGWIEAIAAAGVTKGCNPPESDEFCPDLPITRAQMASMIVRAVGLTPVADGPFVDIAGSSHENDINAIAAAGITKGCNPPANDHFCPDNSITRGELAALINRAFALAPSGVDAFTDDDASVFEADINALVAAGIAFGYDDGQFRPDQVLPRRQMAVFLGRALNLTPMVPPERPPPPYPDIGKGKRIIYSNSQQQVWLIDENEELVDTYAVSGRKGIPYVGTYTVYSKSVNAWAPYGGITMKHMVRFVRPQSWGNKWAYGFHSIPRYPNGQPMQTEDELGYFRSGGCVRQADHKAAALYAWAGIGTTVHAIP